MRLLVVAAHADDETIGMSHLLARSPEEVLLFHATDSAPRNPAYAEKAGYSSREEYAAARRRELLSAMKLAGISPEQCVAGDIADQDAVLYVPAIGARVAELVRRWQPDRIYTHSYEGGHPDHDAVALAVHQSGREVPVWEFAGYHLRDGEYEVMRFLPGGPEEETVILADDEQKRKETMFACFASQRRVLDRFPRDCERTRPAPPYDFGRPPHDGLLYYETRDLGWKGKEWREAAARGSQR